MIFGPSGCKVLPNSVVEGFPRPICHVFAKSRLYLAPSYLLLPLQAICRHLAPFMPLPANPPATLPLFAKSRLYLDLFHLPLLPPPPPHPPSDSAWTKLLPRLLLLIFVLPYILPFCLLCIALTHIVFQLPVCNFFSTYSCFQLFNIYHCRNSY